MTQLLLRRQRRQQHRVQALDEATINTGSQRTNDGDLSCSSCSSRISFLCHRRFCATAAAAAATSDGTSIDDVVSVLNQALGLTTADLLRRRSFMKVMRGRPRLPRTWLVDEGGLEEEEERDLRECEAPAAAAAAAAEGVEAPVSALRCVRRTLRSTSFCYMQTS